MKIFLRVIFLLFALLAGQAMAATCTSIATGDWNQKATWGTAAVGCVGASGGYPRAGDSVIIASPFTVTLNSSYPATNLTIDSGGTLLDNGKNLTLSGDATINGLYDGTGNNGKLIMTGSGSTLSGTGTVIDIDRIQIDANITIPTGSNLSLTLRSEIRVGDKAAATLTIDGTITGTAQTNGNRLIRLDKNNTSKLIVNGTINAPNSYVEIQAGGVVTNNGSVTVQYLDSDGNNSSSMWTQGTGSSLTLSQDSSGTWHGTFNSSANGNTVTYNGTSTVLVPSTGEYWNLAGTIFPAACPVAHTILGSNPCIGVPTVTTNAATTLTATGATLNGRVSSNGAVTTVTFEYGLTTAYGNTVTATPGSLAANATNANVTASITSLSCGTSYHFRANGQNSYGPRVNGNDLTFVTSACPPAPAVVSINTASTNPTAANTVVSWTVVFNQSVTGVDSADFALVQAGGVTGASLISVTPVSATTYTVTANTGTGTVGTLTLKLVDNDSIVDASSTPLGGAGAVNGDFTGQAYTLIVPVCTPGLLFCDDFERSVVVGGSNTADAVGTAPGYGAWTVAPLAGCAGVNGNKGCAGIDSDVPPWSTPSSPRANSTRALFTRWTTVTVTSPVINLAGRTGARLSLWLRRGSDCFSEWPSNNTTGCTGVIPPFTPTSGEEFQVQYKNDLGAWVVLAQYPMDDAPGEFLTPVIGLPDDAMHATFQFRFAQPGGSGSNSTNGGAPGVRGYDYWHVDNVVIEEVPAVVFTGPFCDTFEGDLSRWDMAGTGNVRIGSTHFQNGIHNMDLRWNRVSATTRSTDLSTNSGNNLISFWVKRGTGVFTKLPNGSGSEYPDTVAKGLKFEYRNNLGAWVQLGSTFPGAGTQGQVFLPTAITNNFAIPADAKHANFKLRISMLLGSGLFDQDYWHVDDVCVGTTVGSTDLGLSKTSSGTFSPGQYVTYAMTVTNNGPNADPGPITIIDTFPTGLTYTGGSAGWTCGAAGQVVTCTQSGGLTVGATTTLTLTATVDATASGTVTNTATVGGQANDTSLANNTASKSDTIFVPGYVFVNKPCTLSGVPVDSGAQCSTITWSPQTAGTPLGNVYIAAVNASNVPIQLNATNPTTVNMQFGLSCSNPTTNAGVQATFYDATTTTSPLCEANGAAPTTWSAARALVFPAATPSVGQFSFNYNDVGSVELFMRNSAVTTQMGRSGSFVVKPARFVLSGIKCTTADAVNCGAGALAMPTSGDNPVAADAAGATFIRAGLTFSVTVMAVNAAGNATPNYGRETPTPDSVKLTPTNVVAGMATAPAIVGAFGTFTSGVATGTAFSWDEVGIITLTPGIKDGDYLGAGNVTGTASVNVGRFYPHHFDTAVVQVAGVPLACPSGVSCPTTFNGMVYSGQPFSLTVTAKNASENTTVNYNTTTGFSKTASLVAWGVLGTTTAPTGAGALGVTSVTSFVDGTLTESAERYTFSVTPTAPTNIFIRASDGEASSSRPTNPTTTSIEGGVAVVSGRIKIPNVYGSELLPLPMTATVQYFGGTYWLDSLTDSVTPFALGAISKTIVKGPLAAGDMVGAVVGDACSSTVFCTGVKKIVFTNAAKATGSADVSLSAPNYLLAGSNGAGVNPSTAGRATFGIYKSPLIYRRENY